MGQFSIDVSKWAKKTGDRIDIVVRKISIDLFRRVILMSPVGNPSLWKDKRAPKGYVGGRFRGNWQCAIGNIPNGTLVLRDATGQATISRMTATALQLKAGQNIYLVNNLPYARALEYGHSSQAPAGMVRIAVAEFQQIANAAAKAV